MKTPIPKERMPESRRQWFKWFSRDDCTRTIQKKSKYDGSLFGRDVTTICPRCESEMPLVEHGRHSVCPECNLSIYVAGAVIETIDWEVIR